MPLLPLDVFVSQTYETMREYERTHPGTPHAKAHFHGGIFNGEYLSQEIGRDQVILAWEYDPPLNWNRRPVCKVQLYFPCAPDVYDEKNDIGESLIQFIHFPNYDFYWDFETKTEVDPPKKEPKPQKEKPKKEPAPEKPKEESTASGAFAPKKEKQKPVEVEPAWKKNPPRDLFREVYEEMYGAEAWEPFRQKYILFNDEKPNISVLVTDDKPARDYNNPIFSSRTPLLFAAGILAAMAILIRLLS